MCILQFQPYYWDLFHIETVQISLILCYITGHGLILIKFLRFQLYKQEIADCEYIYIHYASSVQNKILCVTLWLVRVGLHSGLQHCCSWNVYPGTGMSLSIIWNAPVYEFQFVINIYNIMKCKGDHYTTVCWIWWLSWWTLLKAPSLSGPSWVWWGEELQEHWTSSGKCKHWEWEQELFHHSGLGDGSD